MLSRTSVEQGMLLATAFAAENSLRPFSLVAVPGSPLDTLNRVTGDFTNDASYAKYLTEMQSNAVTDDDTVDADRVLLDGILYNTNSADPVTESIPHDEVQEELVKSLIPTITRQLSHVRNVVKPIVDNLGSTINAELSTRVDSALLSANIVEVSTPIVFTVPALVAEIEKYASVTYNPDLICKFVLPMMTEEALRQLIITNKPEVDAAVENWLATEGNGWLEKLYTDFFTSNTSIRSIGNLHSFLRYQGTVYGRNLPNIDICRVTGLFLLANALYDNPPEGVDVKLMDYNTYISDLRDSLGALLNNERDEYYRSVVDERNMIICVEGNTTQVRGDLYNEYLAQGGDVDVIYGNGLREKPYIKVDELRENADALRSDWHRHVAICRQTEERNVEVVTRRLFQSAIIDIIASLEGEDKSKAEVISRIWSQELEAMSNKEMNNVFDVATRLICRALFPHTDAEILINLINEVSEKNPDISPRDAVLVATINYIVKWGRKQITVRA